MPILRVDLVKTQCLQLVICGADESSFVSIGVRRISSIALWGRCERVYGMCLGFLLAFSGMFCCCGVNLENSLVAESERSFCDPVPCLAYRIRQ